MSVEPFVQLNNTCANSCAKVIVGFREYPCFIEYKNCLACRVDDVDWISGIVEEGVKPRVVAGVDVGLVHYVYCVELQARGEVVEVEAVACLELFAAVFVAVYLGACRGCHRHTVRVIVGRLLDVAATVSDSAVVALINNAGVRHRPYSPTAC